LLDQRIKGASSLIIRRLPPPPLTHTKPTPAACLPGYRYRDESASPCGYGYWKAGVDLNHLHRLQHRADHLDQHGSVSSGVQPGKAGVSVGLDRERGGRRDRSLRAVVARSFEVTAQAPSHQPTVITMHTLQCEQLTAAKALQNNTYLIKAAEGWGEGWGAKRSRSSKQIAALECC